ncbi:MAG: Nif3-like dinuclear metal center hexameric protein [Cytophagales bacterium]|nr:MAG: Nif3-like dinuclear metal center hexameric protein [Cytophagales bacterium]
MPQIFEITEYIEKIAPLPLQESYDNCGLLVGNPEAELTGILISIDITEEVIREAVANKCNLIIAHHPLIFKPLKKITIDKSVGSMIIDAIKSDIAIYALHTNLDNLWDGVNHKIAEKLSLTNTSILQQSGDNFSKLTFYVPSTHTDTVLSALHEAGAGKIGNYSACAFRQSGTGQFYPNNQAQPFIGAQNQIEKVIEDRVEVVFPNYLKNHLLTILKKTHPYEEVAFDTISLQQPFPEIGAGRIGYLATPMPPLEFVKYLKEKLNLSLVRHTKLPNKLISKVALCGGSGSFLFQTAKKSKADVYISSDFKYHEFFDADQDTMIADINHYEGEFFTKELIFEHLNKNFANIALVLSKINTNPISYL